MREISIERSLRLLTFVSSISLFFVTAYSSDSPTPKAGSNTKGSGSGSKVAIICLVLVGFAVLSFFLYKFWQKKKREEQYARLLKLFEEDDELELELGLRD